MNNTEQVKQKEFVAYLRVSSKKQLKGDSGFSLEEQIAAISARVESEGGRIVAEFKETQSAWVKSRLKGKVRAILSRATQLCKANGYTLIVSNASRFARDIEFAAKIQNSGIDIAVADMPSIDTLTFSMFCGWYQKQSDDASKKILAVKALQKAQGMKLGWYEQKNHSDNKAAGLSSARTRCYRYFLQNKVIKLHQLLTGYSEMYSKSVLTKMNDIVYPKRMFIEKGALKNILNHINKFERELFELEEGEVFDQKALRRMIDAMKRNSAGFRRFFGDNATIEDAEMQFYTISPQDLVDDFNKDAENEIRAAKRREYSKKYKLMKEQQNALSKEQNDGEIVLYKEQKETSAPAPTPNNALMQEYIQSRTNNNQETTATL